MEEFLQNYSVGIVASVVVLLVLHAILAYSGLFKAIDVGIIRSPFGRLRIAYKFNVGPYKNCGALFDRTSRLAPDQRCIGIYYDDPNKEPGPNLRYAVGSIVSENDGAVDEEAVQRLKADGFKIIDFPTIDAAVGTTFPFPWFVSIFFAIWRVYPKLGKYVEKKAIHARPCIEIYDGTQINFFMPLDKHDHFYVPEASEWR